MKQKSKRILFIYSDDYPWDVRLEKEAKVLLQNGYEIHILADNSKNLTKKEVIDNIYIHRAKSIFANNRVLKIISYYPLWIYEIFKHVMKINPSLIIAREIQLALPVIFINKVFNKKLIFDIAEHFPALIKSNIKNISNPITNFLFCKLDLYKYFEQIINSANAIFVVIEESKNRLIKEHNIEADKIFIVSNTPSVISCKAHIFNKDEKLKVVYTGNIDGKFRGIHTLVEAANILKHNSSVEFNIIGDGVCLDSLQKYCKENNIKNINFLGRKSHDYLLDYLTTQDLGIVPHTKSDVVEYTIPNKLFDYMSNSLPVIVSSATPLKRIVEETDCGYVFEAENPENLANLILSLENRKQEFINKSKNGCKAILEKYNWENDARILKDVVEKILNK